MAAEPWVEPLPAAGDNNGRRRWWSAWVAALASTVLALDLAVPSALGPPLERNPFSSVWQSSIVHLSYTGVRQMIAIGRHPSFVWWLVAATLGAVVAIAGAAVALVTRGHKGRVGLLVGGAIAAVATPVGGHQMLGSHQGVAVWGGLIAGLAVMVAGASLFADRLGAAWPGWSLTAVAAAAALALLVVVPVAHHKATTPVPVAATQASPRPTTPPPTSPSSTTTVTAPPVTAPASLPNQFQFTETADGGYTFNGTLSLGAPEHVTPGLSEGGLTAGTACTIDAQTDAVIPGELQLTNSTAGFDAEPAAELDWSSPAVGAVEAGYSGGAQCDQGGTFGDASSQSLSQGASISTYFFVVLPGYYSPDQPNGDQSSLADAYFTLSGTSSNTTSNISPMSVTGPGVAAGNYAIPVDPAAVAAAATTTTTTTTTTTVPATTGGSSAGPYPILADGVAVRSGPSVNDSQVGVLNTGDQVTIVCTAEGDTVTENDGTQTSLWDQISSPAGYVSDAYVDTGSNSAVARSC